MVSNSVAIARQLMMSSPTIGGGAIDISSSLPVNGNLHPLKSHRGSNTKPKKITFDESANCPSTPCTRRKRHSPGTSPPQSISPRRSSTTGAAQHQTPLSQFSLPRRHYASTSLKSPEVDNESGCSLSISISVAETNLDDKENCPCASASSPPIERIKSQLARNKLRRQNVASFDYKRAFIPETMSSNKRCKVELAPRIPASSGLLKECNKGKKSSLEESKRRTSSTQQKQRAIMKNALHLMKTSTDEESTISGGESSIRSSSTFSRRWLSQNRMRISNVHSDISVFSVSPMKNEVKAYSGSIRIHNEELLKAPTSFPSVSNTLDSYIGTIKETASSIGPPQFHNTVAKAKANCTRSPSEDETMSSQSSKSSERYIRRDSIGEHKRLIDRTPSKLEESEENDDSDDNARDVLTPLPPGKPQLHRTQPSPLLSEGATSLAPSFTTSMVTSTVTSGGGEDLFNVLLKTFDNGMESETDGVDDDTKKDHESPTTSYKPPADLPNTDRRSLSFAPPARNLERGSHACHKVRPVRGPKTARKKKRARSLGVTPKTSHKTRRQDESSEASDHDDAANLSFLASALVATSMLASSPFPVKGEEVASSVETETLRRTSPLGGSLPVAYTSTNEVRGYDTIGATECRTTPRCDPMAMALEAEMLTPIRHQHSPVTSNRRAGTPKYDIFRALADDKTSTRKSSDGESPIEEGSIGEIASFDRRLSSLERRFNGSTLDAYSKCRQQDPAIPDVTKSKGSDEEVSKLRQRVILLEKLLGYDRSNDGDRLFEKRIASLQERLCITAKRLEEETKLKVGLQAEMEATRDNHQKVEAHLKEKAALVERDLENEMASQKRLRDQVRCLTKDVKGRESERRKMQVELDACVRDNKGLRLKLLSFTGKEELKQVTLSSALRELKSLSEDHYLAKQLLIEERRSRQDEVASLQWSLDDISTQMLKMSETMHELQTENSQLKHEMRRMRMERERSITMLRSARGY
ncbi:hypothetical protein THAOC_16331 [Thalassiosira oceanica]|uniref:Uncharacterized protein n=1 Tax=Thalassiosira oceanica TaxID=159749 RepID=K0SA51_THAOC|nr:hypothetical protein THAOC_16331 [Thalassiosira oceanica]|eukprot:EJK63033.1 hypothetical protein THAOC_16331 [Thalassiosira oceanica]